MLFECHIFLIFDTFNASKDCYGKEIRNIKEKQFKVMCLNSWILCRYDTPAIFQNLDELHRTENDSTLSFHKEEGGKGKIEKLMTSPRLLVCRLAFFTRGKSNRDKNVMLTNTFLRDFLR